MTAPTETLRPAHPLTGYLLAASGAFLFATKGVLIKLGYAEGLEAVTLLGLRMAFSVPVYVVIGLAALVRARMAGQPLPAGRTVIAAGLAGLVGYWFASWADFVGLETISPEFERLILFTYPLFVVLFGAAFFRQPVRWAPLAAFGVSYLGLAVVFAADVSAGGTAVAIGAAWVLAAAVSFALYQLLAKPLIGQLGVQVFTCVSMTAAGLGVLVQFLATRDVSDLILTERTLAVGAAVALIATIFPSFLMAAALSRISAQANSTIATLSPIATLVLAAGVLGEAITATDLLGTAMVICGVGLYTWLDRRR